MCFGGNGAWGGAGRGGEGCSRGGKRRRGGGGLGFPVTARNSYRTEICRRSSPTPHLYPRALPHPYTQYLLLCTRSTPSQPFGPDSVPRPSYTTTLQRGFLPSIVIQTPGRLTAASHRLLLPPLLLSFLPPPPPPPPPPPLHYYSCYCYCHYSTVAVAVVAATAASAAAATIITTILSPPPSASLHPFCHPLFRLRDP